MIINEQLIHLNLEASTKDEVIRSMAELMETTGRLSDRKEYEAAVMERASGPSTSTKQPSSGS